MSPDVDDVDWAMGELFELFARAHAAGASPWRLDWDWYWACMRVVYAQEPEEYRLLIGTLCGIVEKHHTQLFYSADAYARTR